jgi:ribosomal protein S18 acetylase RimI-like enzyme
MIITITLIYATQEHFKWLKERDRHVHSDTLKKKISDKQIIIADSENKIIGWLRFGFFWDSILSMNMLFIEEESRNKGISKKLVQFWETEMKKKKHKVVMTTSQSDEEAQHFFRKLGYADTGSLTCAKEPLEIIFIKKLK